MPRPTPTTQCLYCENETTEPHFVSDCCGRGMCDYCYDSLAGTDEQFQLEHIDDEDFDKIKPEYQDATFLCFECADIWQIKV